MSKNLENNPFVKAYNLKTWSTFDESIPFDQIQVEHYLPALEYSIEIARENIRKIKENPEAPNFENTMLALEMPLNFRKWSLGFTLIFLQQRPVLLIRRSRKKFPRSSPILQAKCLWTRPYFFELKKCKKISRTQLILMNRKC